MNALIRMLENHRWCHEIVVLASSTQRVWRSAPQPEQAMTSWFGCTWPKRGNRFSLSEWTEGKEILREQMVHLTGLRIGYTLGRVGVGRCA